jgi:lauroyl/myristoyl acyltransferase
LAARVLATVIDGAAWVGCRVPVRVAHALAGFGGQAEWALRPDKRQALAVNLCHAIGALPDDPEVRRLVRREMVNEARRSADLLWALGRPDEFLDSVELVGIEHALDVVRAGHGLILASLHLGGWEVATAVPGSVLSVPTTAMVADDWLAWAIEHMRVTAGLRVMYRNAPTIRAVRLLQHGGALLVLGDDAWGPEPRTYPVKVLDGRAALPAGIVTLSRLAQAPIVGFTVLPLGPRRWRVVCDPPLAPLPRRATEADEQELLQHVADRWTELLETHAEHWAARYRIRWQEEQ